MKSLSIKLGVILIGLALFGYAEVWGADWEYYGGCDNYLAYYDAQSITRTSKNIARVWVRWDWTEKGVINCVGSLGKKYENLSHSIYLMEINCEEKMTHELSLTYYDNNGGVIYLFSSSSEWDFVISESVTEGLYKEVCE